MPLDPLSDATGSERDYEAPLRESSQARNVNVLLGVRLQRLRVERELSHVDLASWMVIPVEELVDFEAGSRSVSIIDLEGFAQAFNVSISDLLKGL